MPCKVRGGGGWFGGRGRLVRGWLVKEGGVAWSPHVGHPETFWSCHVTVVERCIHPQLVFPPFAFHALQGLRGGG